MLHLNTGVHLHEVEILPVHQELHGTGALVAHGLRRPNGGLAHGLPELRAEARGGSFLDQLLVPPLDGAVPVSQVDGMPMAVRQNLDLHVPGIQHQLFQIHLVVSKAGGSLRPGLGIGGGKGLRAVTAANASAPASGGGLQQHRVSHGLRRRQGLLRGGHGPVGPGGHRDPRRPHQAPSGGFGTRFPDGVPGGTHEAQSGGGAGIGKVRVFGQETIAGVDAVAAGGLGHRQQGVLIQIALRRLGGADAHRFCGQLDMQRLGIRLGIGGHRLNAQLPAGPKHPQGNLPPVGDQNPPQHGV